MKRQPAHAARRGPRDGREARRPRPRRLFRKDIEGLRAVAILAVVLYHAHVGALSGGYVGVDVFFVISGYLITDHLFREVDESGTVSFGSFYGRRIRRLLPASFLVIAVTAAASALILPPLTARSALKDGVACALYVGNYRFALLQTNYLTASAAPSPFQNYWSLGVEEQFYLIWPAVLLFASMAWGARRRPSRRAALGVLGAIAVTSCAYSVWLTHVSQPWAFFSLPTRAWELAVGGLVALAAPAISRLRGRPLLGWVGLVLIGWSVVTYTDATAYPGTAALVPVLGAAAIIAAGCGARAGHGPVQLLRTAPMQVMGRVSYSWYLWHWPMLILVPVALGHPLSLAQNLGVAALSFVVATITFVAVERPIRTARWLSTTPRRSLSLGAALSLGAVIVCVLSVLTLPTLTGSGRAPIAAAAVRQVTNAHAPPATTDPVGAQLTQATSAINAQVARSVSQQTVPANLSPSLSGARADEPPVFVDGCLDSYTDVSLRRCTFAAPTATTTVVLFGDSHAAMWFPAVEQEAEQYGWRLITWTKATCPPFPVPIFSPVLGRTFTECDQWRADVLGQIAAIHPALVILGVARHYTDIYNFTPYSSVWDAGLGQEVSAIRDTGARVMVMGPVPKPPFDVPACLSAHLDDATACTVPLATAIDSNGMAAERSVVQRSGGTYIDTEPWLCAGPTCPVMVDNLVVYRDDNHLTQAYAGFLAPAVGPWMQEALVGKPSVSYAEKPVP